MNSASRWGGLDFLDPDPYAMLQRRHKLKYSYSWQTDFLGNEFLVRLYPRNMFFNSADPDYCATDGKNIDLWRGEEFQVDDKPPENSIATKYNVIDVYRKKYSRYVDFDWISTEDDLQVAKKQSIDMVLEGAIDRFNEFGLELKRKENDSESSQKRRRLTLERKRRLLHEELNRHLKSPRLE